MGPHPAGKKTLDPELVERALQVIARNAAAQAKMIDDMLDMAASSSASSSSR